MKAGSATRNLVDSTTQPTLSSSLRDEKKKNEVIGRKISRRRKFSPLLTARLFGCQLPARQLRAVADRETVGGHIWERKGRGEGERGGERRGWPFEGREILGRLVDWRSF